MQKKQYYEKLLKMNNLPVTFNRLNLLCKLSEFDAYLSATHLALLSGVKIRSVFYILEKLLEAGVITSKSGKSTTYKLKENNRWKG